MATATVSMIRETIGTAIAMIVGVGGVGGTIGTVAESQALRRKPERFRPPRIVALGKDALTAPHSFSPPTQLVIVVQWQK